jgi:hypothetical protein
MHGTIPANGKFPLTIRYLPTSEKTQNVNVTCNIRRKPHNLSLNLKGEGAGVHDTLTLVDASEVKKKRKKKKKKEERSVVVVVVVVVRGGARRVLSCICSGSTLGCSGTVRAVVFTCRTHTLV